MKHTKKIVQRVLPVLKIETVPNLDIGNVVDLYQETQKAHGPGVGRSEDLAGGHRSEDVTDKRNSKEEEFLVFGWTS